MSANHEQGISPDRHAPARVPTASTRSPGARVYGADYTLPGMVCGARAAQPARARAHPRIDTSSRARAARREGGGHRATISWRRRRATVERRGRDRLAATSARNMWRASKVLYHGHAVAAVAATTPRIAAAGAGADRGRLRGAAAGAGPRQRDGSRSAAAARGHVHARRGPEPTRPSNVAAITHFERGDLDAGLRGGRHGRRATSSTPPTVHQGYIEPQACLALCGRRRPGQRLVQHAGTVRGARQVALLLGTRHRRHPRDPDRDRRRLRGQDRVYLEPLAVVLSRKSGRPVKMQMTREEVFQATGPGPATRVEVKIGAKSRRHAHRDGRRARRTRPAPSRLAGGCRGDGDLRALRRAEPACRRLRRASSTSRRSRPTALPARRRRRSPWSARSTSSPRSWASIRSSCA